MQTNPTLITIKIGIYVISLTQNQMLAWMALMGFGIYLTYLASLILSVTESQLLIRYAKALVSLRQKKAIAAYTNDALGILESRENELPTKIVKVLEFCKK